MARALSRLHDLYAESGGRLYHGFLLPRSIVMDLDSGNRVNHLAIAEAGLAFAFGPQEVCESTRKVAPREATYRALLRPRNSRTDRIFSS